MWMHVRVHLINVMLGSWVPERFINILLNSPHQLLYHTANWTVAFNWPDTFKHALINTHIHAQINWHCHPCFSPRAHYFHSFYSEMLIHLLFSPLPTHIHTHILSISPSFQSPSVSLSISLLLAVSLLLCNKRQCRMDVPVICTGIMFWWKMKWSLQTD